MKKFVFMVMPFSDSISESLYKLSTRKVISEFGLEIIRADEIFSTNIIYDDIFIAIEKSAIVIVDISGKNPNCFYELGISHSVNKSSTIMITRDSFNTTPFDVAHFRILKYSNTIEGKSTYEDNLRKTLRSLLTGLPEIYKNEFELIDKIFTGSDEYHSLLAIIALSNSDFPIKENSDIFIEGIISGFKNPVSSFGTAKSCFQPFINIGFVEIKGDNFSLTDIGKHFSNYLEAKGSKLHILNKKVFTKGYKSIFGKTHQKLGSGLKSKK